jgi:hypothetical protein
MAGSGGTFSGAGVIQTISDSDYFSFTTSGGSVTINGNVAQYGAMLDLKLKVFNATGQLVASADSTSLGETLTLNLSSGTYTVAVTGHGWAPNGQGAEVGQYRLEVVASGARSRAGDVNCDGAVTGDDYAAADAFLGTASNATWEMGDLNGDGAVSGDDYTIIDANYRVIDEIAG